LTLPLPGTRLADHEEHVRRAEAAGYTDLWSGETNGPDGFTPLALSAAWTERARLGTGIVGVFQRGPALLAQEAAALADASGGRFVLGIGSSSDRIVEGWNGIPFERPLSKVRETLEFLRVALDGERTASGFKLETAPAERVPIVLAALRGKMLDLAVEHGDGAFTNFLPLGGLPKVTAQLEGAPEGFELLCRFFCLPGEREAVEPLARFMFSSYITVPVYAAFYRWAWLRRADRRDGRRLGNGRSPERGGRGPVGADRGHVHLRLAATDARAPRRLRRRRRHPADPHPDRHPGQARRDDRGAGP
jgi:alkanesulfonate monooxygenase SsuD/methylene tetrahydromethanopterin reductase-like flavin-dependent oxidoreductase (luciferase family)